MNEDNKKELSGENSNDSIAPMGAIVKQTANIDGFIKTRTEFIDKVNAICVEGQDYHIIKGKKSLAKGGAEKIASIFQWNAIFEKDDESLAMLGDLPGLVAFKCTMRKGTKFVGEGRGAALLSKNAGDPNKTLKMAEKSAFINAVLRASGLSDFFTQDLEDMPASEIGNTKPQAQQFESPSDQQINLIKRLMNQKGYSRDEVLQACGIVEGVKFDKVQASKVIEWLISAPASSPEPEDFKETAKAIDRGENV